MKFGFFIKIVIFKTLEEKAGAPKRTLNVEVKQNNNHQYPPCLKCLSFGKNQNLYANSFSLF